MGGDKKSKLLSGDVKIEDHWVKENRLARRQELTLSDLELQVVTIKGDKGYQDISCDSKFMLGIMDKLGNSTQITYRSIGVFDEEIIYLVTDNTGGHGTNEAVLDYSEYLAEKYNILVHHQVPPLPETNMLDLSAWMTVQSKVEIFHQHNVKQHDALNHPIKKAWYGVEEQKLTKI